LIKRELLVFLFLFLFLAVGIHFHAWMTDPVEHFKALPKSSLGLYHPLWLTAGIYLLILVPRLLVTLVKKLLRK